VVGFNVGRPALTDHIHVKPGENVEEQNTYYITRVAREGLLFKADLVLLASQIRARCGSLTTLAARGSLEMRPSSRPPLFWNYVRFSTPPQQWGDTDRRQDVEGRHRAEALGMSYVDSYRDLGISAYHSRNRTNGALGQFLTDLRSAPSADPWPMVGDVLHCENFDRLSRADPEHSLKLFMEIIESGVILMVRDQQYTPEIMRRERWRWQPQRANPRA
jgi:hypothetical protein